MPPQAWPCNPMHPHLRTSNPIEEETISYGTESDDAVLKQLVNGYSTNWAPITECFNSSRLTTPAETRTPVECAARWKERWSAEHELQLRESVLPVGEDGNVAGMATQNEMTTAVKKLASRSQCFWWAERKFC
jgi:hypothetical protein